jgi:CubicO group peptidase (beta-lactamase class C family)
MKTEPTATKKSATNPLAWVKNAIRMILGIIGWGLLAVTTLLSGYLAGWMLYTLGRIGEVQAGELLPLLAVSAIIAAGSAVLLVKFFAPARTVGAAISAMLALLLIGGGIWTLARPDDALFWARQLGWGDSSLTDYEHFPERAIVNAAPAYYFQVDPSSEHFQTVAYRSEGEPKQMDFEEFLVSTHTTSFIVIRDDVIRYEGYFNGFRRDSILTSFSISKSFTSALIGIAIGEGYIGSADDLMTAYLPELKGGGLDAVTIRDLLMMSSGIRYVTDEEVSPLAQITQFTDPGLAYAHPNLRRLALQVRPDGKAPGMEFNYNEYHPMLLGMILERATGRTASEYLQEKIWKPLGMEFPASWNLDSEDDGFELMGSGVNGRAIDFAKFGRLFLNKGGWNGARIVSEQWVVESTAPIPDDGRTWHTYNDWKAADGYYTYMWWGRFTPDGGYEYMAQGHLGQWIYVSPQEKAIIVRFGLDEGGVDSWAEVFRSLAMNTR